MLTYHKRVINDQVVQILTIIKHSNSVNYTWYKGSREYYGEGVKPSEIHEITLEEFRELATIHQSLCQAFTAPEGVHST